MFQCGFQTKKGSKIKSQISVVIVCSLFTYEKKKFLLIFNLPIII